MSFPLRSRPRKTKKSSPKSRGHAGSSRRLSVESLEAKNLLAILIGGGAAGGGADIEALNDLTVPNAQSLGSDPVVTLENFRVDIGANDPTDSFRYTANVTGKLRIDTQGSGGDATFDVQDRAGASIIGGALALGQIHVLPVAAGEDYFLVITDTADTGAEVYTATLDNTAAPTPSGIDLTAASDSGASNTDDVTSDTTPTFQIQADLANFLAVFANGFTGAIDAAPGYDVELVVTNASNGAQGTFNAARLGSSTLWTATTDALADGQYFVAARTRVDDSSGTGPFTGFTQLSDSVSLTIDTTAPAASAPALAATSDTGTAGDGITAKIEPAIVGIAEANAKVRVFSGATLIGQGVVNSDLSDGVADGLGTWEVTVEPLADGVHNITTVVEDAAGNISAASGALVLTIDSLEPQRPTVDLPAANDSGMSDLDNVTNQPNMVPFTVTSELGATVNIKNGNTIIDTYVSTGTDTRPQNLAEGTHLLSAEVLDAALNRSHQSEELVVV